MCFILGVLQSFPGAEADGLDTTKLFTDVHSAQSELVAWASTVVPAMRENVRNAIQHLNNSGPDSPLDIASLTELMTRVEQTLDVHRQCPRLARTSVPAPAVAAAPDPNMDADG